MSGVIDFEAARRRRQGFEVMAPDDIALKVWPHMEGGVPDGRVHVTLVLGEETEELLLCPNTVRAWAAKWNAVADQIDAPAPRLALVEEAS